MWDSQLRLHILILLAHLNTQVEVFELNVNHDTVDSMWGGCFLINALLSCTISGPTVFHTFGMGLCSSSVCSSVLDIRYCQIDASVLHDQMDQACYYTVSELSVQDLHCLIPHFVLIFSMPLCRCLQQHAPQYFACIGLKFTLKSAHLIDLARWRFSLKTHGTSLIS